MKQGMKIPATNTTFYPFNKDTSDITGLEMHLNCLHTLSKIIKISLH